ncbi:MAG: peptidyl-alpha-hydroxyglycine alpha-amidating lyase family protein [Rhizomicrobium sp.]
MNCLAISWGPRCSALLALLLMAFPASARTLDLPNANPNAYPDPYTEVDDFLKLPPGRTMGSTSAVAVDREGNIWVADRCGANACNGSPLDPIMEFDPSGNFIKAFGAGKFLFPHGIFIDGDDHIWVTDLHVGSGIGDDILEFNRDGTVLRTLGTPGVAGDGEYTFNEPDAVLVTPAGDIFVTDGHTPEQGNARIIHYDRSGKFLKEWGGHGIGLGRVEVPHALAMDRRGRLYVADRYNNRIEIFSQDGTLLDIWSQFGRPSALYIDENDILYCSDSESRNPVEYGFHPGWARGIRIGSVHDGIVRDLIPDKDPEADRHSTSGGEGIWVHDGVIYSAQERQKRVVKYIPKAPLF